MLTKFTTLSKVSLGNQFHVYRCMTIFVSVLKAIFQVDLG